MQETLNFIEFAKICASPSFSTHRIELKFGWEIVQLLLYI